MKSEQSVEEAAYRTGLSLRKAVSEARNSEPPIQQLTAIARDVLSEYPLLLDATLYMLSQPGFKPLLAESTTAILHAHKASLIQTLEKIFTPSICSQLCSLLDGFLRFDRSSYATRSHDSLENLPRQIVLPRDESARSSVYSEAEPPLNRRRQPSKTEMPAPLDDGIANFFVPIGSAVVALAVVFAVLKMPTSRNPEARPESIDCNSNRHVLESKAMALPPYINTNDEIFSWESGGKTWQSVYSALTGGYDHMPKSLSAEQISFIESANEYRKRCAGKASKNSIHILSSTHFMRL